MTMGTEFGNRLLATVPHLRAFARTLCRDRDRADDLVQETLLAAWEKRDSLERAECLRPWAFAILRNAFYGSLRRRRNEIEDVDGAYAAELSEPARQSDDLELNDLFAALNRLPHDQREALSLICVEQMSYEEAAAVPAGGITALAF